MKSCHSLLNQTHLHSVEEKPSEFLGRWKPGQALLAEGEPLKVSRETGFCQWSEERGQVQSYREALFVPVEAALSLACRATLSPFPLSFRPPEELTNVPELSDWDTYYFLASGLVWQNLGGEMTSGVSFVSIENTMDTLCFSVSVVPPAPQVTLDTHSNHGLLLLLPRQAQPPSSAVLGHLSQVSRDLISAVNRADDSKCFAN